MARFVRAFPLRHRGERQGLQRTAPPPPSSVHVVRPRKAVMAASTNAVLMGLSMSASVNRRAPPPPETPGEVVGPVFVTSDSAGTLLRNGRMAAPYKQNRWTVYQTVVIRPPEPRFVANEVQAELLLRFSMREGRASRVTIITPAPPSTVRTNPHRVVTGTSPPTPRARALRWTYVHTATPGVAGGRFVHGGTYAGQLLYEGQLQGGAFRGTLIAPAVVGTVRTLFRLPVVGTPPPIPTARVERWSGTATDSEHLVGWLPVVGDSPPRPKARVVRWTGTATDSERLVGWRPVVGDAPPLPQARTLRWRGAKPHVPQVQESRLVVGDSAPAPTSRTLRWTGAPAVVVTIRRTGWVPVVGTPPPLPTSRTLRWSTPTAVLVAGRLVGWVPVVGTPPPQVRGWSRDRGPGHPGTPVLDGRLHASRQVVGTAPPLPQEIVRRERRLLVATPGVAGGRFVHGGTYAGQLLLEGPLAGVVFRPIFRHPIVVVAENKSIWGRVVQGDGLPLPDSMVTRGVFSHLTQVVVENKNVQSRLVLGSMPPLPEHWIRRGRVDFTVEGFAVGRVIAGFEQLPTGWIERRRGTGEPSVQVRVDHTVRQVVEAVVMPTPESRQIRWGLSHLTQVLPENKLVAHRVIQGTVPLPEHMVVRGVFSHPTQVVVENRTIAHRVILGVMPLPEHMVERGVFIHSGLATDYVAGRVVVGDAPPLPKHRVTRGAFVHITQVLPENKTIEHRVLLATMPLPGDLVVRGTFHYPAPVPFGIVTPRQVFGEAPPLPEGWTARRPGVIVLGATAISRVLIVEDESGNTYLVVDESGQTYFVTDESL